MFSVRVTQNRLFDMLRTDAEDELPVPVAELCPVVATCDSDPVLLAESRVMLG